MNMTAEEMMDSIEANLKVIERKLIEKQTNERPNPENLKKNSHLHIFLETSLHDNLKKEAEEKNISLSELARRKLRENNQLDRIENKIDKITKLNCS